jgi:hypothetical protein
MLSEEGSKSLTEQITENILKVVSLKTSDEDAFLVLMKQPK